MKVFVSITSALLALCAATEQIHLSLTGLPTEMAVSWVETGKCSTGAVKYGRASSNMNATATSTGYFWPGFNLCMHDTVLTNLVPGQYYYAIASFNGHFTNQPTREGGLVYAVFADFGLANDVALAQLISEGAADAYDYVIHAGDFAYNLEDNNGQTGNGFLNALQPFTSEYAYMPAPGNHEADGNTFEQYLVRFAALDTTAKNSGATNSLWYSFNEGLVHWVAVDTELWAYGGTPAQIQAQYTWLTKDLAGVDRSSTPWVVAYGHKQDWMDSTNFTGLEDILQAAKVNLYFCGHQHNYQRLLPQDNGVVEKGCVSADNSTYTNCNRMTTVVVGSPGCREKTSAGRAPDGIAVFAEKYGYGHLTVVNSTVLHWQWEEIGTREASGAFVPSTSGWYDEFWLVHNA